MMNDHTGVTYKQLGVLGGLTATMVTIGGSIIDPIIRSRIMPDVRTLIKEHNDEEHHDIGRQEFNNRMERLIRRIEALEQRP